MNKILPLLLLGLLAFSPPVHAATDLTQAQVAAYVTVVKADRARDRGANAEARTLYADAMAQYHAIAEQDARWHPDIVQFRVAYCQAEMDGLKDRPEGQAPAPAPEEAFMDDSPVDVDTLERIIRLESENENLRAQQQALAAELETAQKARPKKGKDQSSSEPPQQMLEQMAAWSNQITTVQAERERVDQELQQCQIAREAALRELASATNQLATQVSAPVAESDLAQLTTEVEQVGEALKESARQLDAAREAALDLLKPKPAAP